MTANCEMVLGTSSCAGNVMGPYLDGLFEEPAVLQALFGAQTPTLETVFEVLADYLNQHTSADVLRGLIV